ncbi:hypothetical protein BRD17_06225 [Halobacteriales archaeon SW_7_68_16]|nr:MAG: hypothetical protein BRD17_06225 [Halobacteriales archaeon SW_7_68_16]
MPEESEYYVRVNRLDDDEPSFVLVEGGELDRGYHVADGTFPEDVGVNDTFRIAEDGKYWVEFQDGSEVRLADD